MSTGSRSSSVSSLAIRGSAASATTRSRTGARRSFGAFVALVAAVVGVRGAAAATAQTPLPWRVGGRVAFTVDAAGFPDSSGYSLDVYIRLTPATLANLTDDFQGAGHLHLEVEHKGGRGPRRRIEQDVMVAANDSVGGLGRVVLLRFPTTPGTQRLKVHLEDTQSHKKGLLDAARGRKETGDVNGEFTLPGPQQGHDLSDPEFAWSTADTSRTGTAFERSGHTVIPNPERLYGLFARQVRVSFSARAANEAPWHWRVRILDGRGGAVASQESTLVASRWMTASYSRDVNGVPAGGYDMEVSAWQDGDDKPLSRKARFSVAWQRDSWIRSPVETEDYVHLLLQGEEEDQFLGMHPGEQERWLDDFWRRRDPDPDTPENEALIAFRQRIAIADQRFGRYGLVRGMFSDMGRVFVRYGEPSEILRQVMPAGDETLAQMLQVLALEEERPIGSIRQHGPGGDMRPFEVWIYEGTIPVPIDADPNVQRNARHERLLFLFVDEHGLGDYRMRYSNE